MSIKFRQPLLACATLALAGVASAADQPVTIFGTMDVGLSRYTVSGGKNLTAMTSSNINNSRLGFTGSEDLGNGLKASFWLETAVNPDDGTAPTGFQRRSTVSLSGPWGEVRLGRDFVPTFWNDAMFDPFGAAGAGTNVVSQARSSGTIPGRVPLVPGRGINNVNYIRTNNAISYFLPPNLGGFYGQFQYTFHESVVPGSREGQFMGTRVGYLNGPLNVSLAAGKSTGANPPTNTSPDIRTTSLSGSYNFGVASLMGEYSHETYDAAGVTNTHHGYLIGTSIPVTYGNVLLAYSSAKIDLPGTPTSNKIALGYIHNLSKRTALYATYAQLENKNGAMLPITPSVQGMPNASSSGLELGIRHNF